MALLPYVRTGDGTAPAALERFEAEHGRRSLLLEQLAHHEPLLSAHSTYFRRTVAGGTLDRTLKELVGVVVSETNDCEYCASSHRGNLVELLGIAPGRVEAVADGDYGDLRERQRAALAFAERVARDPKRVSDPDVEALREAGFDDEDVVELLGAIGQFVVANLYADALSVHPSDVD